jgi:RNA polymerase sigma-70 factor (ECF subfamily)
MSDPPELGRSQDLPPPHRQEEFIALLNGSHALLLRYVMSLVVNRHDAEDVLQRAGMLMWRRFETYESGTDFIAWATTIAFYETRNFLRTVGRARVTFDDQLLEILAAERALDVRRWNPRLDALEACLDKLDSSGRELVDAVYGQGLDATEVARRRGLAVQTIYNKLNLIRRALAECVERRLAEAGT